MAASPSSTAAEHEPPGTAAPSGPSALRLGEWGDVLKRTVRHFLGDDCMGLAQQVAFSSLLALFPAVILVVGLLGLLGPGAFDSLTSLLGTVAPDAVLNAIDVARASSAGHEAGSAVALAVGAAGSVWAASGGTGAVIKAVNRAHDLPETRPFWRVRLLAIALVALAGLVVAGVLVLIVFGGPLGEAIARRAALGSAFTTTWDVLRWPIAFVGILLFLAVVYVVAPSRRPRGWRWVVPGSLLGGLLWLGLSGLFALYTSFSGSYDRTYGSLAGAIVLLLWLNYSAVALLLGAELNSELDRQADIRAGGGPSAGLVQRVRRDGRR